MLFTSTRNKNLSVPFSKAVRDCIPEDGGVFVPAQIEDLRRWIYYIDESTSFSSIAGALTSAFLKDEFSPIICEKIATTAFPFEPKIKQLDKNLFSMELYNSFTGCHRDFGVSYLVSYLETTLELNGGNAVFLDFTHGGLGALLSKLLHGKKNIKAVLVYQKGTVRGIDEEDLFWNGGNIYPVEIDKEESEIKQIISEIFENHDFVQKHNLTVANTTNVCRLLAQMFIFPYAFAQVKNRISDDVYFALDSGNYGTLIAGLYSWRFALPLSGFLVPSSNALACDAIGNPVMLDSFVNINNRNKSNPTIPANLERLESFFEANELMMRNFVYLNDISEDKIEAAAKELFMKYKVFADRECAKAYAAVLEKKESLDDEEDTVVLVSYNHPSLSSDFCRKAVGEKPEMPESIAKTLVPTELNRPAIENKDDLIRIIEELSK